MNIQKASSSATFPLQDEVQPPVPTARGYYPLRPPCSLAPQVKIGMARCLLNVQHFVHAGMTSTVVPQICRKTWALLPSSRCFPSTSPKKRYLHTLSVTLKGLDLCNGGLIPPSGSWPVHLVCAFSYHCACPRNNHPFSEPGCACGSEMFPGKECWGNCMWGTHPRLWL